MESVPLVFITLSRHLGLITSCANGFLMKPQQKDLRQNFGHYYGPPRPIIPSHRTQELTHNNGIFPFFAKK